MKIKDCFKSPFKLFPNNGFFYGGVLSILFIIFCIVDVSAKAISRVHTKAHFYNIKMGDPIAEVKDTAINVKINFQPATAPVPVGYLADSGLAYDPIRGYGWINTKTKLPEDHTLNMRFRKGPAEVRFLTMAQMQAVNLGQTPGNWEYAVPNGTYRVTVGAGDILDFDNDMQINIEGLPVISDFRSSAVQGYTTGTVVVKVNDGKITVDAKAGVNTKISFIIISSLAKIKDTAPPVASVRVTGTALKKNVFKKQAKFFIKAQDTVAGITSLQYSLNNAAFKDYTAPVLLTLAADYSVAIKTIDANGNQTITSPFNFKIVDTASVGQHIVLKNMDNFPSNERMVFSFVQTPWHRTKPMVTPFNANHDNAKLRISNQGYSTLTLSNLILSNPSAWKITALNTDSTRTLPLQIAPSDFVDVNIQFIGKNSGLRVKILEDTLTVISNDTITPIKKVTLAAIWQKMGESTNEPFAEQIMQAFGFKTNVGYKHDDGKINGTTVVPKSDEFAGSYFVRADTSRPVSVVQMAAYHGCCNAIETFRYFEKGTTDYHGIFTTSNLDGQSVLPHRIGSKTALAQSTFIPTGPFGIKIGQSFSDRTMNVGKLISLRFLKVIDSQGNEVPNAYLVDCDYIIDEFVNFDYQDNIYFIENVKPESGSEFFSELVPAPSNVNFGSSLVDSTKTTTIKLNNSGKTYPDSSQDPLIKISSIKIIGPNAGEFSVADTISKNVPIQSGVNLNVTFAPKTLGIKNAALLVQYGSAIPLRIPLYGIANTTASTVTLVKRIKGGANSQVVIGGKTYESDRLYRHGSIKLDGQKVPGPIAATGDDKLYQTYLSSLVDLAETRLEIPLPAGNYMVRMHFAENTFTAAAARVFSVNIENQAVLPNYDIFNDVGYRSAIVKDFAVTVADTALTIKLDPTVNRAALAAVEIFKAVNIPAPAIVAKASPAIQKAIQLDTTMLKKKDNAKTVLIYPNPNSGYIISLKVTNFSRLENVTVTISNMMGIALHTQTFVTGDDGSAEIEMPMSRRLDKGVYIVNSYSASGPTQSKLIIK